MIFNFNYLKVSFLDERSSLIHRFTIANYRTNCHHRDAKKLNRCTTVLKESVNIVINKRTMP
ncbi:MAG: hypothetical protein EOP51_14140 [Sphingobacteriales bacterium]|nr:MAG: hypothetical protein EOP51_14140 [Sphingobacteriales bacterium]